MPKHPIRHPDELPFEDERFLLGLGHAPPREQWAQGPVVTDPTVLWPYPHWTDDRYTEHGPQLIYGDYHAASDGSVYADRLSQWHGERWQHAWHYAKLQGDSQRTARSWGYALSYIEGRACEVVRVLVEISRMNGYPYYYVSWRYVDGSAPVPLTEEQIAACQAE